MIKQPKRMLLITLTLLVFASLCHAQQPSTSTAVVPTIRLTGPIVDAYQMPFLYVYGTISPNNYENGEIERTAREVVEKWKVLRNRDVPIKKDVDVTPQDIQQYHLVLYGNENNNKIIKQVAEQMPIRFKDNEVVVGDRSYKGYDVGAIFVHPNPLNPNKYVLVYGAVTFHGISEINAVKASETDFVIFNEQTKIRSAGMNAGPLETGYFDKTDPLNWKVVPLPKPTPPVKVVEETSYQPVQDKSKKTPVAKTPKVIKKPKK
jgi:hypothetical protein